MLAILEQCHICDAKRNWPRHGCTLTLKIETTKHQSWGNWGRGYASSYRSRPYRYFRYHDVVWDDKNRFAICPQRHRTSKEALKCGARRRRALQLGRSRIVLTSVKRAFRNPPGGATPRGRIEGLSETAWTILKQVYEGRCYYCNRMTSKLQKEHLIPLARGGTNHVSNIVPACWSCNRRKSTLTDKEFFKLLADEAEYSSRRRRAAGVSPPPRLIEDHRWGGKQIDRIDRAIFPHPIASAALLV